MVFSSEAFLFLFLPLVLLFAFLFRRSIRLSNIILLVFSIIFYSIGEKGLFVLIIISSFIDFFIGRKIYKTQKLHKRKSYVIAAISLNLIMLVFFKYIDFFISIVNSVFALLSIHKQLSPLNIPLPIGISFFTFQSLSYSLDVYYERVSVENSFRDFLTFVALFPQLIAGPIVRYIDVQTELKWRRITTQRVYHGLKRFAFGLAKKVLIANSMGYYADILFNIPLSDIDASVAWLGAITYALQIYFDFSGYSDMAIGLGQVLGFQFPENFNYPYAASSIQEFWRRWHMTLSTWFRDYLYIPLGGNRQNLWRTTLNQYIVFVLCGLWHGAAWNFVLWGLFHGSYLTLEKFSEPALRRIPRCVRCVYTLVVVLVGWILFRANNLSQAKLMIVKLFSLHGGSFHSLMYERSFAIPCVAGIVFSFPWWRKLCVHQIVEDLFALALFFVSLLFVVSESYNPFIYFRF
jgi:alginate O-acetyltransferase complex protein AlgI